MISYTRGFPTWFMIARTFAVPKTDAQVTPALIRPITVLSQLYRLWSQILTRQLLHQCALKLPSDITGFLPQRGCVDASYQLQHQLEQAIRKGQTISGCSLDLIKCFDTIRRIVPKQILAKIGLQDALLEQWSLSQDKLQRTWVLGSSTNLPTSTNNGCPEGDPFSVACMIVISYA